MKKRQIFTLSAVALIAAGIASAEKETIYISPNNDGIQDFLEVPIQIKDKRYVTEWAFVIENEAGEIVRTIGNKEKRDSRITFFGFFKSLFTPKSGVDIPKTVLWNGVMDSGEIAPDGLYRYYMTAGDDNGNKAQTKKLTVVVDNTPPEITISQPDAEGKIFGEGSKVTFNVKQGGSSEDKWTGVFSDAKGNAVLTKTWTESEPLPFEWNGTDDSGAILPDGVYSYKISATDRAGNKSEPASISNIIYSSEKPVTAISLSDGKYFNKEISLNVKIPVPDAKSPNKLSSWSVEISSEDGKIVRSYSGEGNPPDGEKIVWNGTDNDGKPLAEGTYFAKATAKYTNGFVTEPAQSPAFTLDRTAPVAKLSSTIQTFSPDGDGNLDSLEISQAITKESGAPVENWTGKILDSNGKTVREFSFGAYPPEKLSWDGMDSSNQIAADGLYSYVLSATDAAGNEANVTPISNIKLDTSRTEILLTLSKNAFNPKKPDSIKLNPVVKSSSKINSYTISIRDEKDNEVWTQNGTTLPSSFTWNGAGKNGEIADGKYVATLQTQSENGAKSTVKSKAFTIDTVAPQIELKTAYALFSPEGDGRKDEITFETQTSNENTWTATVFNEKGEAVRAFNWQEKILPFSWDGKDDAGNTLPDGKYKIVFESEDEAGNRVQKEISGLSIDTRETKAYVTAEHDAFSPNGNGSLDTQKFTIRPTLNEEIESWNFSVKTLEGENVVRSWTNETDGVNLPQEIVWDGKNGDGQTVADNAYKGSLTVVYKKGNLVQTDTAGFISCVTPPEISVKTSAQNSPYFSPDNDGEDDDLFIELKRKDSPVGIKSWSFQIKDPKNQDKNFWTTGGKSSITEKLIWDGKSNSGELVQSATDYPYVFTVTDTLGMTSEVKGEINVDILVYKVGSQLKMAVPSIIFRSDAADFDLAEKHNGKGLTPKEVANNERVLERIAKVLNKFKNYKVQVVGHANSMSGTEEEETTYKYGLPLQPLSEQRAKFVRDWLTKHGVDGNRLSTKGMGGKEPVVARDDKANVWKNRRVEFILDKNK